MRKLPDPRFIFALALFFSTAAVVIRDECYMTALLLVAIICAVILKVGLRRLFGRLKRLWQVAITVTLLQIIFAAHEAPVLIGLLVLFRLAILIISASMFTLYKPRELIRGMVQLRLPYEVAYMISIGIRFIPQLSEELKDSLTALQLRGVVIKELKLKKRLRLYTYLLLPTIASCLQNARELAMCMEMRAFKAMRKRTNYWEG